MSAVAQYKSSQLSRKCQVDPKDGKWGGDYQSHYKWCISATVDAARHEATLRDKHLLSCGAIKTF